MNDRELLELAAKAAGLEIESWGEMNGNAYGWHVVSEHVSQPWWPLTDDGDALRLAVRVGVCVVIVDGVVVAQRFHADSQSLRSWREKLVLGDTTPVRRAIVHAAAEIGRSMP